MKHCAAGDRLGIGVSMKSLESYYEILLGNLILYSLPACHAPVSK